MQKRPPAFLYTQNIRLMTEKESHYTFIYLGVRTLREPMQKKCSECKLVNFADAVVCVRCGAGLEYATYGKSGKGSLMRRAAICVLVCVILLAGFYLSLIASASSLSFEQKQKITAAIAVLREKGFEDEVFLLDNLAVYRSTDNWLNASVAKENAYAATNFPFEILTIYPDFFTYPIDDTERAAILLHESKHLSGKDEHDAYQFVWMHRKQLGWTADKYGKSPVWRNIRQQTIDNVPLLFVCDFNHSADCSE